MIRAFTIAGLGALLCGATFGQTTAKAPAFEVAAVKVNTAGESVRPSADLVNGRLTLRNVPMLFIVAQAYRVGFDRVVGPGWLETQRFDIVANSPPDTTGDTLWLMLQNLLAERFKLTVHRDQTPVPVYALVVGRKGPKLQEAAQDSDDTSKCNREGRQITCQIHKTTMAKLADQLPHWVSRNWFDLPIVDQTGLQGTYDFSITWTLTDRRPGAGGGTPEADDPTAITLFDALQDQLGLKLEQRKAPVDRIVVDHIERVPTDNSSVRQGRWRHPLADLRRFEQPARSLDKLPHRREATIMNMYEDPLVGRLRGRHSGRADLLRRAGDRPRD